MDVYALRSTGEESESAHGGGQGSSGKKGAAALFIIALLLVSAYVFVTPSFPSEVLGAGSRLLSRLGLLGPSSTTGGNLNLSIYSPLIIKGGANISFPADYQTLAEYAVGLINQDRASAGLRPVVLSPNPAGQQHTDSMLAFGYFSHYDTQGYKPYMRYTLLGGAGGVAENVAGTNGSHFSDITSVEAELKFFEDSMMNNDVQCCANGHRVNILNPLHNRVSIGISYNATSLYFDEDFENYYINMSVTVSKAYILTMKGTLLNTTLRPTEALVAYDSTPTSESPSYLSSLAHEYGPGTIIGGVLPPCNNPFGCPTFETVPTLYASTWQFGPSAVDFSFSLASLIRSNGTGVYTAYLLLGQNTSTAITSYSVFVS